MTFFENWIEIIVNKRTAQKEKKTLRKKGIVNIDDCQDSNTTQLKANQLVDYLHYLNAKCGSIITTGTNPFFQRNLLLEDLRTMPVCSESDRKCFIK